MPTEHKLLHLQEEEYIFVTSTCILVLSEHFWDIICSVWIIYE